MPDIVQTFYMDPAAVGGSSEAFLTSIDVFFKNKPKTQYDLNWPGLYEKLSNSIAVPPEITEFEKTKIGPGPGVILRLIPTSMGGLSLADKEAKDSYNGDDISYYFNTDNTLRNSLTRVPITGITASSDASIATSFVFQNPLRIKTGISYAMVFSFEADGFELWANKKGHKIVGTNSPSSGTNSVNDGKYYNSFAGYMNDKEVTDTTIKYRVNAAKFIQSNTGVYEQTIELVNKNYEFFKVDSKNGTFKGGEYVYQNTALATGTLKIQAGNTNIIGTGTTFDSLLKDCYIAAFDGTNVNILKVESVDSNTSIRVIPTPSITNASATFSIPPVGKLFYTDEIEKKVYLTDSSANSTNKFTPGSIIKGEVSLASANISSIVNYSVDQFTPKLNISSTVIGNTSLTYSFAYSNGSQYIPSSFDNISLNNLNEIRNYDAQILSRSNEVASNYIYGSNKKSGVIKATIKINTSNTSVYSSPIIDVNDLDMFMMKNTISNTYTYSSTIAAQTVTIDSEVMGPGLALSKHISTKVAFANNRFAEDLRVYMTAYRPLGTEIRVYGRVHNSSDPEAFDDKAWTPLVITDNANVYSSSEDTTNFVEYTCTLPEYPEDAFKLPSSVWTQLGNNVIAVNDASVNAAAFVSNNSIVRIHDPIIPDNYMIASVSTSNATHITLASPISNSSFVGDAFSLSRSKYPNVAFNNPGNYNISRYYSLSGGEFDKFDSMQIKVVLLSDSTYIVPKLDSIQVLGLSA